MTLELRPYQLRDVPRIREPYATGARAVLYVAPTGSGKTILAAFTLASAVARGHRGLFLAGRTELLDQTRGKLAMAGITDVRLIQAERDLGGAGAAVTIASEQTLSTARWLDRMPEASFIVQDEAHHSAAAGIGRIIGNYPTAKVLGLTATPMRGDRKALSPPFDALVVGPSVRELTDLGHLVPCLVFRPPEGAVGEGQIALDPVTAYMRHGNDEPAVVFCASVDHAKRCAAEFVAAGIPAAHIDGKMSAPRRAEILDALRSGAIRVMPSVDVVTEGFDLPALVAAIMARKFRHVGRWLQAIGRVLRPSPETGKTCARVIDLHGSVHELGLPDTEREYSLTGRAISLGPRDAIRQCTGCGCVFSAGARVCPGCGAAPSVEARAMPRVVDVDLEQQTAPLPRPRREYVVPMTSKRRSICHACRSAIEPGQPIWWATQAKLAMHQRCAP